MSPMRGMSRRESLQRVGAGATTLAAGILSSGCRSQEEQPKSPKAKPQDSPEVIADRKRRMKWWRNAGFGMFVHWGLYSVLGRHEWAMEEEGIPVAEYELLAKRFTPKPNAAQAWANLARQAGMKYMVMTSKHHEGFCMFDTNLTSYSAPKQSPGRDLVGEYLEAARAEGLRAGLYYSLMDWHHPDGVRCLTDEAARRRFVDYTHGEVREICSNYGKLDVLWYDVAWPLDAKGWESEKMNKMVFELQPNIIVNNRNLLPGDFSTPEQRIGEEKEGREWETCMTMNDSWGYHKADDSWKTPKKIVQNLAACAGGGGNYLLNIGPKPDGSIPEDSVRILTAVGEWMRKHGSAIYETERSRVTDSAIAEFTRKGNTVYMHVHYWPGSTVALGGLRTKVKNASLLTTGQKVDFKQEDFRVQFTGLPEKAPDELATVIAIECAGEPVQETERILMHAPTPTVD